MMEIMKNMMDAIIAYINVKLTAIYVKKDNAIYVMKDIN